MKARYTISFFTLLLLLQNLVAHSQTLTATPTSLPAFTTALGTPSFSQGLTLNGSGFSGDIIATAPSGFEVSYEPGGAPFGATSTFYLVGGIVTNRAVYFRMTGAVLGPVSGNATFTSGGTTVLTVALTGTVTATPTYNPPATFYGITPSSGSAGAPFMVTFQGSGFVPGASGSVFYGPFTCGPVTFVNSNTLTAMVSVNATAVPVAGYALASNPPPGGGNTSTAPYPGNIRFTAVPAPPVITGFSPANGRQGTTVEITGQSLYLNNATTGTQVSFNGTLATVVTRVPSENQYTVLVPIGATTGPITLVNQNGTVVSSQPFVVNPPFFENFETGTKTSYTPASVLLQSCGWTLAEALIGTTAGIDKFNGTRSARLRGGGFVEMDIDKPNGAGVVTVNAATYATETGVSFVPEISTDGGITYTSLLGTSAPPVLTGTLTPYSFTANRLGNVRLRFSSTNTASATNPRVNLDDISITDYRVGTATHGGQVLPELAVFPNPAHDQLVVSGVGSGAAQASLYDLAGRLLLPPTVLPATQILHLPAALPGGLYLLQIKTAAGSRTVRLLTQ